jgi:hypothetical protein
MEACNSGHGHCLFAALTEVVGLDLDGVIEDSAVILYCWSLMCVSAKTA